MIPAFRPDSTLPVGRHEATPAEVEQRLVQPFPLSVTRAPIYRGWRDLRQAISQLAPIDMEWIDGSYVTGKRDPEDIDVATFIEGELLDRLTPDQMQQFGALIEHWVSKLRFGCDAYLVPVRPKGHPMAELYYRNRGYWDHWWSHSENGDEKGYVSVRGEP